MDLKLQWLHEGKDALHLEFVSQGVLVADAWVRPPGSRQCLLLFSHFRRTRLRRLPQTGMLNRV